MTTATQAYLAMETPEATVARLLLHQRTSRPAGSGSFVTPLESMLGTPLRPGEPGRPRKTAQKRRRYSVPGIWPGK